MGGKFKHTKDNDGIDYYPTPPSITRQMMERETFDGAVLEPACGSGLMTGVIKKHNKCFSSDKLLYPSFRDMFPNDHLEITNFLERRKFSNPMDNIITNPPFCLADEFLLRAKQVAQKKIAFLLPLDFYHGQSRFINIWTGKGSKEFPLKKIWVFIRRPFFQKGIAEDTYTTGAITMAWFIWDKDHKGDPTIGHIDNTKYVKGTGEYNKEVEIADGQILMEEHAS